VGVTLPQNDVVNLLPLQKAHGWKGEEDSREHVNGDRREGRRVVSSAFFSAVFDWSCLFAEPNNENNCTKCGRDIKFCDIKGNVGFDII
jgi:hypothetical protein